MLKGTISALALLLIFSCSKEEKLSENLPEPVKQRMEQDNCTCDPYIDLYQWQGKYVYYFGIKGPNCNGMPSFIDQSGNKLELGQEEIKQFEEKAKHIKNIWTCSK